jgi:diguanylate cyclase (GGDEF)-like protein
VQLQKERGLFRMDHAEAGRIMAQKLALPDLFVDAIAFHHNLEKLNEFVENEGLADAVYVASLFPHPLSEWHRENVDALCVCLREHAESIDAKEYLAEVQREFYKVYSFFHKGAAPETQLTDLFESATREAANNTTELVGTVNELMRQAATAGMEMNDLLRQQDQLQEKTTRDPLTGVLNREGFNAEANELLAKAARYGIGFAVAYLDIDQFKTLNDTFSHEFGDFALKTMVAGVTEAMPQNQLLGRMGGDEFVVVLNDCTEERAKQILDHVLSNVGGKTVRKRNHATQIFVSAGLVYVCPTSRKQELDALVCAADKLMYQAKRAGGNQLQMQSIQA